MSERFWQASNAYVDVAEVLVKMGREEEGKRWREWAGELCGFADGWWKWENGR